VIGCKTGRNWRKCISRYDPEKQFVEIQDLGSVTRIIGTNPQINIMNPFNPSFSEAKVLLPVTQVVGNAEDYEARKK
jgi:hypothetical protein